jgi:hypothetical protein
VGSRFILLIEGGWVSVREEEINQELKELKIWRASDPHNAEGNGVTLL